MQTMRFRTIWISDVHLGSRDCQAPRLFDFLRQTSSDHLYLVGDIIDFARLRSAWYWRASHSAVLDQVVAKVLSGTRVTLIAGNHDDELRRYLPLRLGSLRIRTEVSHVAADGRRWLVTHGDHADAVVGHGRWYNAAWLRPLGDAAYDLLVRLNALLNAVRQRCGAPYWSLARWAKHRTKEAVAYIAAFESVLAADAARRGFDGVICGHIHQAALRPVGDVVYANDGDWVESCTALVEHFDGALEVLDWSGASAPARIRTGARPARAVMQS